jgi:plastocyanin
MRTIIVRNKVICAQVLAMNLRLTVALIVALYFGVNAAASEIREFGLVIRDHAYQPAELKVPAGTKFKLRVSNEDATAEEFESLDLNRETMVLAKRTTVIYLGPLRAGTYAFFGDFHRDTAQGRLIAE